MTRTLDTHRELFGFFHERLTLARGDDGIDLTDDAAMYLAQMLADRARLDRDAPEADTLAELHLRHADATPAVQVRAYRELGDRAMLELALFEGRIDRSVVGRSYYEDMGSAAYARLDQVMTRWFADAFGTVFRELAERFRDGVALIRSARHGCADGESIQDLLARWEHTPTPHVARLLWDRGILIGRPSGSGGTPG